MEWMKPSSRMMDISRMPNPYQARKPSCTDPNAPWPEVNKVDLRPIYLEAYTARSITYIPIRFNTHNPSGKPLSMAPTIAALDHLNPWRSEVPFQTIRLNRAAAQDLHQCVIFQQQHNEFAPEYIRRAFEHAERVAWWLAGNPPIWRFNTVTFPEEGMFIRVGGRAVEGWETPVRSARDAFERIVKSQRVADVLERARREQLKRDEEGMDEDVQVEVVFMPWDVRMDRRLEYRVFCAGKKGGVTAICCREWNRRREETDPDMRNVVRGVSWAAQHLWKEIEDEVVWREEDAWYEVSDEIKEVRESGYVFDMWFLPADGKEDGYLKPKTAHVELVAIRAAGTESNTSSLFFRWKCWPYVPEQGRDDNHIEWRYVCHKPPGIREPIPALDD